MKRYFQPSISALIMSAMLMSSIAATISITAYPAFSQGNSSDNANRNENSNRGGRDNSNARGADASSLGALNAAHANANAFANASTNSRVGMIEIYKMAVGATAEASVAFDAVELALETFETECGVEGSMIDETVFISVEGEPDLEAPYCENVLNEAAALDETVDTFSYDSYVAFLTTAKEEAAAAKVTAEGLEETALKAAANKVTNDEVIAALWDLLEAPAE